jgi:uncharacterized protein (DUF58 family)
MADSPGSSARPRAEAAAGGGAGARTARALHPDPRVAERLAHLTLTATHAVEGFMAGRHRSPHRGVSVEFVERRPYVQGDDLRHLDWKAYARNDRLAIKRYEEETNLECTLIVDASGSMGFAGADGVSKYDYACQVAASLAHLVLRERDGAAMALFDQRLDKVLPASTSPAHLEPILLSLAARTPHGETDFAEVLGRMTDRIPRPGLVVLISDLFGEPESLARGLDRLVTRNHELIVLHVMHRDELEFPYDRLTRFEGLEQDGKLLVDAAALRESYLRVLSGWREQVRKLCHVRDADYHLIDTGTPLEVSLSAYLGARAARRGGGR